MDEFCVALMEQIASIEGLLGLLLRVGISLNLWSDINSAFVKYNRQQSCLIFGNDLISRTDGRLASFAFEMINNQKFIVGVKNKTHMRVSNVSSTR